MEPKSTRMRSFTWPDDIEESALRQKKVGQTIPVHTEFRRPTYRREIAALVNSIYKDTGGIVVAHWDQTEIKKFDVFVGAGSKGAIVAVNKWIARGDEKSREAAAWAKLPAFDHAKWYQEELERQEEERLQVFLGQEPEVEEGAPIRVKIVSSWPDELIDYEVCPRAAFGNELQALNDIRKENEVWIALLPNNEIQISGSDIVKCEAAEVRYKTMVERIRIDKCGLQQGTNVVLDEREGIDVILLQADDWWPNHNDFIVPRLLPSGMMDEPGSFRADGADDIQLVEIRDAIRRALETASYKRGSYDFVVRLGCIALDSGKMGRDHIGKKHGKEKFVKSINGKVDLRPKRWLLDPVLGTQLFRRVVNSNDLLRPIKSAGWWGSAPATLKETRPVLRGWWIFKDPNSAQRQTLPPARNVGRPTPLQQALPTAVASAPNGLIVVQIDWTDDGEGSYDKTETKFYRLDPGKYAPKMNMDINLLELGESRAWSFALESMTLVSRSTVPPVLDGFAKRAAIKQDYSVASTDSFAEWDPSPSVKSLLLTGRTEKVYLFGVQDTCYKAELTAMWYPGQTLPCWGLAVRHTEWATHLIELERLQAGHQANWGNTISTFLPDDGGSSIQPEEDEDCGIDGLSLNDGVQKPQQALSREGIKTLVNILLQLSEIVSSVTLGQGSIRV